MNIINKLILFLIQDDNFTWESYELLDFNNYIKYIGLDL